MVVTWLSVSIFEDSNGRGQQDHKKLLCRDIGVFGEGFCRRFRIYIDLFKHIAECVKLHDRFFLRATEKLRRRLWHNTYQKVTALRLMAYGIPADHTM
jgi:hypothetical protein